MIVYTGTPDKYIAIAAPLHRLCKPTSSDVNLSSLRPIAVVAAWSLSSIILLSTIASLPLSLTIVLTDDSDEVPGYDKMRWTIAAH